MGASQLLFSEQTALENNQCSTSGGTGGQFRPPKLPHVLVSCSLLRPRLLGIIMEHARERIAQTPLSELLFCVWCVCGGGWHTPHSPVGVTPLGARGGYKRERERIHLYNIYYTFIYIYIYIYFFFHISFYTNDNAEL